MWLWQEQNQFLSPLVQVKNHLYLQKKKNRLFPAVSMCFDIDDLLLQ